MKHKLDRGQASFATLLGSSRAASWVCSGLTPDIKSTQMSHEMIQILGAQAEVAFSAATQLWLAPTIKAEPRSHDFTLDDGRKVDIKSHTRKHEGLTVSANAAEGDCDVFVCACVNQANNTVTFFGYATREDILDEVNRRFFEDGSYVYYLSKENLRSMSYLFEWAEDSRFEPESDGFL